MSEMDSECHFAPDCISRMSGSYFLCKICIFVKYIHPGGYIFLTTSEILNSKIGPLVEGGVGYHLTNRYLVDGSLIPQSMKT